jgi:hypothetical protein
MLTTTHRTTPSVALLAPIVMALQLGVSAAQDPTAEDALYAPLYGAAIRRAAVEFRCTTERPCCFSVAGENPSRELKEELRDDAGLKPKSLPHACRGTRLDVVHVGSRKPGFQAVNVSFGEHFMYCTYFLRLTDTGWAVVLSETECLPS